MTTSSLTSQVLKTMTSKRSRLHSLTRRVRSRPNVVTVYDVHDRISAEITSSISRRPRRRGRPPRQAVAALQSTSRFLTVRTGLAESIHDVSVFATDVTGEELYRSGDPDRPLFYRSAVKPLQATVALEAGVDLFPEHVAVACASHSGWPAHIAIVRLMLRDAGLDDARSPVPCGVAALARRDGTSRSAGGSAP